MRLTLVFVTLVAFSAFTASVVLEHGYLGFVLLALREPWGMQMLLDLALALTLFAVWMSRDARRAGIAAWPYVLATLGLGSIGALAYLAHRELVARSRSCGEMRRRDPAT